jgi:ubiquinone/menaquinone biosynthesis C-methylase UbiE
VEFVQASADEIPYPSAEFDHLLCTNSFHHYRDPNRALTEMHRVIKPGGQLVIFENAPDLSWYTWAWDRILRIVEKGHIRYYPSRELGEMLSQAGFERVNLCHLRNEFLSYGKLFASIQVWSCYKTR